MTDNAPKNGTPDPTADSEEVILPTDTPTESPSPQEYQAPASRTENLRLGLAELTGWLVCVALLVWLGNLAWQRQLTWMDNVYHGTVTPGDMLWAYITPFRPLGLLVVLGVILYPFMRLFGGPADGSRD
jgi:hypothetical protein